MIGVFYLIMFINNINPIIFQWGMINVRWYGALLAVGLLLALLVTLWLFKRNGLSKDLALDFFIWLAVGGAIGARFGYIIFYNFTYYFHHPREIIFINHGGLSSHGLALGLVITFFLFTKIKRLDWKKYIDLLVIPIPLIAAFIRFGNFINSEIIGRPTDAPWGIKFPAYELETVWRHPVQIYESSTALAIFFILLLLEIKYRRHWPLLFITHLFILIYFGSRFLIEFFKEFQIVPPEYFLTMGQFLSIPFIIYAGAWFIFKYRKKEYHKQS
jgi:phosphatidylglycerol:prolipoprotein diacylglycerol transferase